MPDGHINPPRSRRAQLTLALLAALSLASVASAIENVTLHFKPQDVTTTRVSVGDQLFVESCFNRTSDVGAPNLPARVCRLVIPRDFEATDVIVGAAKFTTLAGQFDVPPRQPPYTLNTPDPTWVKPDPQFYEADAPYPPTPAVFVTNEVIKGYRVATVLVYPLRYHPRSGQVDLLTEIQLGVTGKPGTPPEFNPQRRSTFTAARIRHELSQLVLNVADLEAYQPGATVQDIQELMRAPETRTVTPWPSLDGLPVDLVIITSEEFVPHFAPLALWKNQLGYHTVIRTVEDINAHYVGVDPPERIRHFIIEAGTDWGTNFFLLGGDTNVVPARQAIYYGALLGPTDFYYATAEGNWNNNGNAVFGELEDTDGQPLDLAFDVGRAPAETPAEADTFVTKVLAYEQQDPPITGFAPSALFLGGSFSEGWDWGQETMQWLWRRMPTNYNFLRLYNQQIWGAELLLRQSALDALEDGYHFIFHADHSNPRGMGTGTVYSNQTMTAMDVTADNMQYAHNLAVIYSLGCSPNAYDVSSISEAFMNLDDGGAVAFIGNARNGYVWQDAQAFWFADAVFYHGTTHIGTAFSYGRVAEMSSDYRRQYSRRCANLLGDPSMRLWTAEPDTLTVTHPSSVPYGQQAVGVTVRDGAGNPVSGATVCLYKDSEVLSTRTTTTTGYTSLSVSCDTGGQITVTASAQNYIPVQSTINVTPPDYGYLYVSAFNIDDDENGNSNGNDDGVADVGETIELPISITNSGLREVYGLSATLVSLTAGVTVSVPTHDLPDIAAGHSATSPAFVITIDPDLPANARAQFRLDFEGYVDVPILGGQKRKPPIPYGWYRGSDTFSVLTRKPGLEICTTVFYEDGTAGSQGNGNEKLEAGEIAAFFFEVGNSGQGLARDCYVRATGNDGYLRVLNRTAVIGDIPSLATGFTVSPIHVEVIDPHPHARFDVQFNDIYRVRGSAQVDISPTHPPSNLTFTSGPNFIDLAWTPSDSDDVRGHHVYRCPTEDGDYTRITALPQIGATVYHDDNLGDLMAGYYRVSAIDESGNESNLSPALYAWRTEPLQANWPVVLPDSAANIRSSVALQDVNDDQRPEIFFASEHGMVYGFYWDGRELYDLDSNPTTISGFADLEGLQGASAPAISDVDRDGFFEVFVTTRGSGAKIYGWKVTGLGIDGEPTPLAGWPRTIGSALASPAIANLHAGTENPEEEIVVFTDTGSVYVMDHAGNDLTNWPKENLGVNSYATPTLVDLDGDGDLEIIVGDGGLFDDQWQLIRGGKLFIWNHDGSIWSNWPEPVPGGPGSSSATVGDIDNDSQYEILQVFGNRLYAYELTGTQVTGWIGGKPYTIPGYVLPNPVLADVTGDNVPEIFLTTADGIAAWDGAGNPLTGWPVPIASSTDCPGAPAVGDINDDGIMDIIFGHNDGYIYALQPDGTCTEGWPLLTSAANIDSAITVGDVDADGDLDVLVGAENRMYIWDCSGPAEPGAVEAATFHVDVQRRGVYNGLVQMR